MKSFDKFNVEAMVHHIALKEGMSYDEVLNEFAPALAAPPMWPVYAAGGAALLGLGGWALRNLRRSQTNTRPAVDYGQGGDSFASSTEKPKAKVTTSGGVPAQPAGKETTIDPKAKPVKAPEVPKPKPRSTDWGSDPSTRPWGASGSSSAKPEPVKPKPEPVKPEQPKRKLTPIRDIAAVGTGAAIGKATPPIGKKPDPQLGADDDKKPEKPKPAPQLGADDDKKPKPKPKPRVKTQDEIDREQGRNDAEALPPASELRTINPPRINVPPGTLRRSRTP